MTNEEAIKVLTEQLSYSDDVIPARLKEAYEVARSALEQTTWIPVSERLPEDSGYYIATTKCRWGNESFVMFYCDGMDWERVIAWMPLPEPYRKGMEE